MTAAGGPANSTLYVLYLYRNAFNYGKWATLRPWPAVFSLVLDYSSDQAENIGTVRYYQGEER